MATGGRGDTGSGIARRSLTAGRRRGAAVACAVAVGLLTACSGGDSDASAGTPTAASSAAGDASSPAAAGSATSSAPAASSAVAAPAPAPAPAAQAMTVIGTEMAFELDSADVPAGEWTITLTNAGRMTHDLVVEQDGEDIARTDKIHPNGSTTLTVTLAPGRYVFYCSVGNHRAMGMEADVTVS